MGHKVTVVCRQSEISFEREVNNWLEIGGEILSANCGFNDGEPFYQSIIIYEELTEEPE